VGYAHPTKAGIIMRDKLNPSSERVLYNDYDCKDSVAKKENCSRVPQGAWRQDELIGGNFDF
jgi:hypothetical protein